MTATAAPAGGGALSGGGVPTGGGAAGSAWARIRWTVEDGLTLVGREFSRLRHHPGELVAGMIFPAVMVLLFGYVFGSAITVPGGGDYRAFLMPGLFAMVTFTSVMAVTMRVATDASRGVMDRFRSMPMARSAVPFGHTGSDAVTGIISMAMMVLTGLAVGWRPHHGVADTALAFVLIVLLRYGLSWAGVCLGLAVENEQTADQMLPLVFPVTMISNSFVPTQGMPGWLRVIAEWNPVSALAAASRTLLGNPGVPTGHVPPPLAHPVAASLLWSVLLVAVFLPLSIRLYGRKGR